MCVGLQAWQIYITFFAKKSLLLLTLFTNDGSKYLLLMAPSYSSGTIMDFTLCCCVLWISGAFAELRGIGGALQCLCTLRSCQQHKGHAQWWQSAEPLLLVASWGQWRIRPDGELGWRWTWQQLHMIHCPASPAQPLFRLMPAKELGLVWRDPLETWELYRLKFSLLPTPRLRGPHLMLSIQDTHWLCCMLWNGPGLGLGH